MEKITKKEFLQDLQKFIGKKQYLFATFKHNINYIKNMLEYASDVYREEHISYTSRVIIEIENKNNYFKINSSKYYWNGKTDIYRLVINEYTYYILHNITNNNIVVYENIDL